MQDKRIRLRKFLSRYLNITIATAIAGVLLSGAVFYACSGGDGGSDSSDTDLPGETQSAGFQEVFTDGFHQLTPLVATSAVTDWDGWSADGESNHQYSVLTKLFNPDSGWESVYGPVDEVDGILEILETYEDMISENGENDIQPDGEETYTVTVTDFEGEFQVPYFGDTQAGLTRQVVIESQDESWRTMVVYDMEGDDKAMVVHTIYSESGEDSTSYMVFRATFNETTQLLQIWAAGVADKTDSFKIQFIWKGNLEEETFALTQYTNAAKEDQNDDGIFETDGFWKVMGGGSLDGQMAFRAHNRDSELDDYFVVVTMADILSSTAPTGYPDDAANIDSSSDPVQGYIDEAHDNCLDYLDGFPEVEDLSGWSY